MEEIVAKIELNVSRDADEDDAHPILEEPFRGGEAYDDDRDPQDRREVESAGPHGIHATPQEEWYGRGEDVLEEQRSEA